MTKIRTAEQMKRDAENEAMNLPIEKKRKFWSAMTEEGKNLGEARAIAGIDDVMVAAHLVIQCHKTHAIPMRVEEIE